MTGNNGFSLRPSRNRASREALPVGLEILLDFSVGCYECRTAHNASVNLELTRRLRDSGSGIRLTTDTARLRYSTGKSLGYFVGNGSPFHLILSTVICNSASLQSLRATHLVLHCASYMASRPPLRRTSAKEMSTKCRIYMFKTKTLIRTIRG
jgi:hypothetical protein